MRDLKLEVDERTKWVGPYTLDHLQVKVDSSLHFEEHFKLENSGFMSHTRFGEMVWLKEPIVSMSPPHHKPMFCQEIR